MFGSFEIMERLLILFSVLIIFRAENRSQLGEGLDSPPSVLRSLFMTQMS